MDYLHHISGDRKFRAFTLIELLVVIAIISLLVSILLPSLQKARDLAKQVICATQLKTMGAAYIMYSEDNQGQLPAFRVIYHYLAFRSNGIYGAAELYAFLHQDGIYNQYLDNSSVFYCPLDEVYTPKQDIYFISYNSPRWSYWASLGISVDSVNSDIVLQWDRGTRSLPDNFLHGDNRNILCGDIHVESENEIIETP